MTRAKGAQELGIAEWSPVHSSAGFRLWRPQRSDVGAAIPETLSLIAAAHGRSTAARVASQIEYPWI